MSIRAMAAVWEYSSTEGAALLVALALADHANADDLCWPSQLRIARQCRVSKSTVQRCIGELAKAREITRVEIGNGRGKTTVYRITLVDNLGSTGIKGPMVGPFSDPKGTGLRAERARSARLKGVTGDAQTVRNRKEPRDVNPGLVDDDDPDLTPPDAVTARVAAIREAVRHHPAGLELLEEGE
jgi:hypothetical protein